MQSAAQVCPGSGSARFAVKRTSLVTPSARRFAPSASATATRPTFRIRTTRANHRKPLSRSSVMIRAGTIPDNGIFLSNGKTLLGVDPKRGGAIFWLSNTTTTENVINTWDAGRLLQQSYYGYNDGSTWNGKPWVWNPVQGGSWDNQPSRLDALSISKTLPSQLSLVTTPRNWGGTQLLEDVKMRNTYTVLDDGRVRINASMTYSGTITHPQKHQEVPACFFDSKYSVLTYRDKTTNAIVQTTPSAPGTGNLRTNANATWAGYIDPSTGKGIYVSCAQATLLTAYRVSVPTNPPASNTSYLAPLLVLAIVPNATVSYETFIEMK